MADDQAPAWGGPARFGKYELVSLLGTGGMAEVFLARAAGPRNFERRLVVKRMLPHLSRNEEFVEMFVEEAKLSALLYHGNIVQVFEFGEIDGQLFLAMEHVDGTDLRTMLKARTEPLPPHVASYIAMQTLQALSYAHTRCTQDGRPLGIVHRDVTPANILLSRAGEVKLCDFGIAKVATRHTSSGSLKGKFGYMSPEQVHGEVVDSRSDLFAVGVLLWEMLAGKRLFVAENDVATLEKVRAAEAPELTHLTSAADRRLRGVVRRALQRDPARRHADAKTFAEDLRQHIVTCVSGDPVEALRDLVAQIPGGARGPAPSSRSGVVESARPPRESRGPASAATMARSEAVTAVEPVSLLEPHVTTLPGVQPPPRFAAPRSSPLPDLVPAESAPARAAVPRQAKDRRVWIAGAAVLILVATGAVLLVLALRPAAPPPRGLAVPVPPAPGIDLARAATSEVPAPPPERSSPPPGHEGPFARPAASAPSSALAPRPATPGPLAAPVPAAEGLASRPTTAGPRRGTSPRRAPDSSGGANRPPAPGPRPPTKEKMIDPFALGSGR